MLHAAATAIAGLPGERATLADRQSAADQRDEVRLPSLGLDLILLWPRFFLALSVIRRAAAVGVAEGPIQVNG